MTNIWIWIIANPWFCVFTILTLALIGLAYSLDHFRPDEQGPIKPIFLGISTFPLAAASWEFNPKNWLLLIIVVILGLVILSNYIYHFLNNLSKKISPRS